MKDESKQLKTKILVCCHKPDIMAIEEPYLPIQVGKAVSNVDLGFLGDDSGDNISAKNGSYCELTGMYWAWKNLKNVDVIGLCHYRRYFDFHKQCKNILPYTSFPSQSFDATDLRIPEHILVGVNDGRVVVAKPKTCRYNLMMDYCFAHNSDDYRVLRQVIKETQNQGFQEAFFQVMYQRNSLIHYNMFIMKWADFDDYCNWLFPILSQVESRIDISHYTVVQRRVFGYMAERLFNVWLVARAKKVIKCPVIWFNDGPDKLSAFSPVTYWVRTRLNNIANILLMHKNHDF